MAGDWIKWCKGLPQKKEVLGIAEALGVSPIHAAGMCMVFWEWLDGNIAEKDIDGDGNAHVTLGPLQHQFLDRLVGADGFATALAAVGWLNLRQGSLTVPNFTRHNGQTGKSRALTSERVSSYRKRQTQASSPKCNAPSVTREEKRREEKNKSPTHPLPPPSPGGAAKLRLPAEWECVREEVEGWFAYLQQHGKYPIDPDLQAMSICRLFSKPEDLKTAIQSAIANGWVTLTPSMVAKPPPKDGRGPPEPEPLSVTVHRLMQQREAAAKPR